MKKLFGTALASTVLFSATALANASGLLVEVEKYHHELPSSVTEVCYEKKNCPEIDISYILSNQEWVNKLINQTVNEMIADDVVYQPIKRDGYNLQVPKAVKKSLDKFALEQMEIDTVANYMTTTTPAYLGHVGSLEVFEISGYNYYGGAHGLGFVFYLTLDSELKKEISLDDLLITGKKKALSKLVEAEFDKWIIENKMDSNPADYKTSWSFSLTDNFLLTEDGLKFLYQPYAIAPYAAGMPELTVGYDKLDGIVKSKYLQAGKQLAN